MNKILFKGGFELHNDTSASEVVDRLLAMLNQYLISHQKLQLDQSFKVYLKVLSSDHSVQKKLTRTAQKKKTNSPNRCYKGILINIDEEKTIPKPKNKMTFYVVRTKLDFAHWSNPTMHWSN